MHVFSDHCGYVLPGWLDRHSSGNSGSCSSDVDLYMAIFLYSRNRAVLWVLLSSLEDLPALRASNFEFFKCEAILSVFQRLLCVTGTVLTDIL